jgi:hypothetical protein
MRKDWSSPVFSHLREAQRCFASWQNHQLAKPRAGRPKYLERSD